MWVTGDGTKVEVKSTDDGKFEFDIVQGKLDYSYTKVLPVYVIGLAPLNGAIKGKIELVKTPMNDLLTQSLPVTEPIKEGVEIWLKETNAVIGYTDPTNSSEEKTNAIYGPVLTTEDGTFEITGLPVGVGLDLIINGFNLDDGNFFTGKNIYQYLYKDVGSTGTGFSLFNNGVKKLTAENNVVVEDDERISFTDVGTFYLFTEGTFAVVTANTTGSPSAPISPTGNITLTFSEAINDATLW